jgi:hypothetical protein
MAVPVGREGDEKESPPAEEGEVSGPDPLPGEGDLDEVL